MTIYVNTKDFKCYTKQNAEYTLLSCENSFFDNKCQTFIEGYRFVPIGESWTREDGVVFTGEMIAPWRPYSELDTAQREYEQQLLQEYKTEKEELNASYNEGINSI